MTTQFVGSGVTSTPLTVSSGNELVILSGGVSLSSTVLSGGWEDPTPDGLAENVTVSSGGYLIGSGQVGGGADIFGTVNGVTAVVSGATPGQPAFMFVETGARMLNVTVDSGVWVANFGLVSGGVFYNSGVLSDKGVVSRATASSGDILVQAGGLARGDVIDSGGYEVIDWENDTSGTTIPGGLAVSETINSGGVMQISAAGTASATHVESGGVETIFAGGKASGTVMSGGYEFDFGQASATLVRYGGHEEIERGGVASGSVVSNGGREVVSSAGTTEAATISAGGNLMVSSGGRISGGLTIAGGTADISGTMAAGQTASFIGSGVLGLYDLAGFHAYISGMTGPGQKVDLGDFTYSSGETVSWTQSGTSGTLTISDGAQTARLTLDGTYVSGDFDLATDGSGGTYVYDSSATPAAAPTRFTQAMAGFSGREQSFAAIHAGGSALLSASPLATAATSGR
jgi:autotransporter passenger strand-loop-strand repeat protein